MNTVDDPKNFRPLPSTFEEFCKYSDDQPRDERGRWEGSGGGETAASHRAVLEQRGWKQTASTRGENTYRHSDHPGHSINHHVNSGQWAHHVPSGHGGFATASGYDHQSLATHLDSYYGKK